MIEQPIRIAHIVGKVIMAGVDAVVMNYYRNINRNKYQFDFFMDGFEITPIDDEIRSLGGRIFKLPAYENGMNKNLKAFRKIIIKNNYKIIHCHMNTLSIFWLREAKIAGIPIRIAHSHSTAGKGEVSRNLIKYALKPLSKKYANQFCTNSHYAGRWLFGKKFYASGKVNLVKNAIDVTSFAYNENIRNAIRIEFGISEKQFVIGNVGRFMYQKNHEYLIEIFNEIFKLKPDSMLLLVGDGPLKTRIESLVKNKGLVEKVIFTGISLDVPKLMEAMDCFILPSRYEGLGMVVVEAQTAGLPCYISTRVPKEVILTNHCKSISLDTSPKLWANMIYNDSLTFIRSSDVKKISEQGYNIGNEVKILEVYYDSIQKNS